MSHLTKRSTSKAEDSASGFPSRASWTHGIDLVFLVGCPRSGTTWVQAMLASHADIYTGTETHFFDAFSRSEDKFSRPYALNISLSAYFSKEEFYKIIAELFWCLISKLPPPSTELRYFLENTPIHCQYADFILNTFPNARFIHLIRDGRAVVASLLRISRSWGARWAPKTAAKATAMWMRRIQQSQMIAQRTQNPNQYIEVRYEDLRQSPHQHLTRLFEWLGLPADVSLINSAVDSNSRSNVLKSKNPFLTIPKWNKRYPEDFFGTAAYNVDDIQLSHLQRLAVEYLAGDLLRELDYPEVKTQFSASEKNAILKEIENRSKKG